MNAERRKPRTLSGIAPEATPRHDGKAASGESRRAGATIAPPPHEVSELMGEHVSGSALSLNHSTAQSSTENREGAWPAGPSETGLSWKSLLGLEEPPAQGARPDPFSKRKPLSETRALSSRRPAPGAGFYSSRPAPEYVGPERKRAPSAPAHVRSTEESQGTEAKPARRSLGPPRPIFFPPHIREQASGWLKSGSLSLANCSSPRHKRAVQRALLLALLSDSGYEALPLGIKQRVGWLFSPGWECVAQGTSLSELNDLMTVLGVALQDESRDMMLRSVLALLPQPLPLVRPPSSFPPARR